VLRLVFFGTPDFAVPTLGALIASRHEVVGVVTQPDRPVGRGQRVRPSPVKTLALEQGLPVWQPDRLRDEGFMAAMQAVAADLGVVAAYGRILPEPLLALPRLGMVNVHASLLPAWRGASPVQHAVMAGDRETGVTIMRVVKALDAGATFARIVRPIGPDETAGDVERDLAGLGAGLLVDVLEAIERGTAAETPQDEAHATYAPRLTKDDGRLDWSLPAPSLHDRVRGLQPWPMAYAWLDGRRLTFWRVRPVPRRGEASPPPPGTIVEAAGGHLVVAAGAGTAVEVLELQPEGKRPMAARDFLAGHRLPAGACFDAGPPAS